MIRTIADLPVDKFIDLILLNSTGQIGCPPTEFMSHEHCNKSETCNSCWLKYIKSEDK